MAFSAFLRLGYSLLALTLGSRQLNWHIRGDSANDGSNFGQVPFVTIEDVLTLTEIKEIIKYIVKQEKGIDETWWPIKKKPQNCLQKAIRKIVAIDIQDVLPDTISSHIAGVSYRVNMYSECRDRQFHFDGDEATQFGIFPGVPVVSPLLSTVTYLSDTGGPTVLLNYTVLDAYANATPRSAFLVMPRKGKHLAFDPRLFHGVLGDLRYSSSGSGCSGRRIMLGMNFWETQMGETYPGTNWPTPGIDPTVGSNKPHVKSGWSYHVIPMRSDLLVPVVTEAAAIATEAEECPGSWRRWNGNVQEKQLQFWFEHSEFATVAKEEKWFKICCIPHFLSEFYFELLYVFIRFPTKPLQNRSAEGATLQFRIACEDIHLVNVDSRRIEYKENAHLHRLASYMLGVRCDIFGSRIQDIIPPTAAPFCDSLLGTKDSSKGHTKGRLEI